MAALGRLVLNFRLITILLAVLYLSVGEEPIPGLLPGLLLLAVGGLALLLTWDRFAPVLMRHPLLACLDLVVAVGVLLFTGPDGPFLYYTLGSAFLAGVLYGWMGGLLLSVMLVAGYALVVTVNAPVRDVSLGFDALVAVPSLYLLAGAAAAAVRGLLLTKAATEEELAVTSRRAASSEERARLAREMHDTLGKTLHGIALSAAALPGWVQRRPGRAVEQAGRIAAAAEAAASQARELIADLRSDRLDLPLPQAVDAYVRDWSARAGIDAGCRGGVLPPMSAGSRYELFCILKEALRNVERHASASTVEVELTCADGLVALRVRDDGTGMDAGLDLDALPAAGHFGLVGMRERAERAGGRLEVSRSEPHGTAICVQVAARSAADMVPMGEGSA